MERNNEFASFVTAAMIVFVSSKDISRYALTIID
jgi:hypothetical protein